MSTQPHHVFGLHAVQSLLERSPERILRLQVAAHRGDKKIDALLAAAKDAGVQVETVSKQALDKLSNDANHQGVVALCMKMKTLDEAGLKQLLANLDEPAFFLILDSIQDPHNLGACLRSADAAGVHAVIAPKDKSVGITPTVSKVACGAAEIIPFVQVTNLARTIEFLKSEGVWIYGAAGEATYTIYQTKLTGAIALAMGAEGDGLRRLTRELCDGLIKIPMHGSVSSLNVSVATGVCLFEAVRQRKLLA